MSEFKFNPEVALEREEAAFLATLASQPGFKVLQKIMRSGVDQFTVSMINTDESDEKAVLARHKLSKAAAVYYTWVTNVINNTIQEYIYSTPTDKPVESAENLDIGEHTDPEFDTEEEPW
jgi:hypothetical protein